MDNSDNSSDKRKNPNNEPQIPDLANRKRTDSSPVRLRNNAPDQSGRSAQPPAPARPPAPRPAKPAQQAQKTAAPGKKTTAVATKQETAVKKTARTTPPAKRGKGRKPQAVKRHGIDKPLMVAFLALLVFGLLVLYTASFYKSQDESASTFVFGSGYEIMLKQLMGIALGGAALLFMMNFDYHRLNQTKYVMLMLAVCFVTLILVLIPGIGMFLNGARRWINLGITTYQPSELAKFGMVLYMAYVLSQKDTVENFRKDVLPTLLVPFAMFALIMRQPNLSTGGAIIIVMTLMLFVAGVRMRNLGVLTVLEGAAAVVLVVSEEYRMKRYTSFLNPWADAADTGFQLTQSLIAIGSGGLFGNGIGEGKQKYAFLPYPESDFIFAVIAEDFGLIGCIFVIALFAAFVFLGIRVAMRASDRFGCLLATGITSVVGIQTILHIAVVSGVMPTTGLPLPFFSAGGTSISIFMAAVGVLLNISRYTRTEVRKR